MLRQAFAICMHTCKSQSHFPHSAKQAEQSSNHSRAGKAARGSRSRGKVKRGSQTLLTYIYNSYVASIHIMPRTKTNRKRKAGGLHCRDQDGDRSAADDSDYATYMYANRAAAHLELPAPIWGHVLDYLPYMYG